MIRFIIRTAGFLFIITLIAAYFTNPTMDDFKTEVKKYLQEEYKAELSNPALSLIAEESLNFVDDLTDKLVKRDDYYFFSLYTIELPTGNAQFLGLFQNFIPLNGNPLAKKGS